MLTRMTEDDWTLVLEIFRAVCPRRGDKGSDDRRFLEALHYFTVHNITWRALPAAFGNWNSVWKRFARLSKSGTFERFFHALAGCSQTSGLLQMFDSTSIRAHVSAAGAKGGQQNQALGYSRGGFGTKIHIVCDCQGLPLDFHLTGNEASDTKQFEILMEIASDEAPCLVMADKGYDARSNRDAAIQRGSVPIIPHRKNAKEPHEPVPKALYALRARIEQLNGKLKRFKRIAMRCEKTKLNYASFIAWALGLILIKSVHTA